MAAIRQSIARNAIGLGIFAVITAGVIAVTQVVTAERIADQVRRAEAAALFEIIPEQRHDNDLLKNTVELAPDPRLGNHKPVHAWVARKAGEPVGIIIPVTASDGYSGNIRLLVGIDPSGTILGVRVTAHRETPGLGDKIELRKSNWILSFNGRSLAEPEPEEWAVVKDGGVFDQFTGATITPRAVVHSVRQTLDYVRDHQQTLLHDDVLPITEYGRLNGNKNQY